MLMLVLIVLIVLMLTGGSFAVHRYDYAAMPVSAVTLILVILLIAAALGYI